MEEQHPINPAAVAGQRLFVEELSFDDAKLLIKAEKEPESLPSFQDIRDQIETTLTIINANYRCVVWDRQRRIKYDFHVHTSPADTVFSIGFRFDEVKYHLIRLDFGPTLRHVNHLGEPNETIIIGSHAHILSPNDKYQKKNVIPIGELDEFRGIKRIKECLGEFIDYTKIKS